MQAAFIYFGIMRHVRLQAWAVCTVSFGNIRLYWDVELTHTFDSLIPACKFSTGHPETCDLVVRVIVVVISGKAIITTKGAPACIVKSILCSCIIIIERFSLTFQVSWFQELLSCMSFTECKLFLTDTISYYCRSPARQGQTLVHSMATYTDSRKPNAGK